MKKNIFLVLTSILTLLFPSACKNESVQKDYESLKAMRQDLLKNLARVDTAQALRLINKSDSFALKYPTDTLAPKVLFSAADLAHGIGQHGKAIKYWGIVHDKYPKFKYAGDALFLQASTFDTELADSSAARRYYNRFLQEYPNHGFTDDAKTSLQYLGVPLTERVKLFDKQNSGK